MPRVWISLFFGYNGTNFYGMQYQKQQNIKTIQRSVIKALKQKNFITTQNPYILQKQYKWSRAARTDRGVHAVVNGISAWLFINQQYYNQDQTLNKQKLDKQFRQVFQIQNGQIKYHCFKKVLYRFEMRSFIKARDYCYICPIKYFKNEKQEMSKEKVMEKINKCCQKFIGTHNFHNYSKDLKAKDAKATRYVLSFRCQYLKQKQNQEMVKFQIRGQSFIYHQIRKIIGAIIFIFQNEYQPDFLQNTFFRNQIPIPLAPPFGLYLNGLVFDSYNKKKDIPETLQLDQNQVQKYRQEIQNIILQVDNQKWDQWLTALKQDKLIQIQEEQDKQKGQQIMLDDG